MSSSVYEIVMLPGGDVVLQRADDSGEQLVRITFSKEVKAFLGATSMEIAKAMIDAGIDFIEHQDPIGQIDDYEEDDDHRARTLH